MLVLLYFSVLPCSSYTQASTATPHLYIPTSGTSCPHELEFPHPSWHPLKPTSYCSIAHRTIWISSLQTSYYVQYLTFNFILSTVDTYPPCLHQSTSCPVSAPKFPNSSHPLSSKSSGIHRPIFPLSSYLCNCHVDHHTKCDRMC